MTTAKMASRRVAAWCLRKRRKAYLMIAHAKQLKTVRLQQELRVREVRSQLERIESMVEEFQEEMIAAYMVNVQLGCDEAGPGEEFVSDARIDELDDDIHGLILQLQNRITALRRSEEISVKQGFQLDKQTQRLLKRYTDCGMYSTEL